MNCINLIIAYDHHTINIHTAESTKTFITFFVSLPDIEFIEHMIPATTNTIVTIVHIIDIAALITSLATFDTLGS
jgi:hypothetical protein